MKKALFFTSILLLGLAAYGQVEFISQDAQKTAIIEKVDKGYRVTVNSIPHQKFDRIIDNKVYFLTDSLKVVYIASQNGSYYVVVNDQLSPPISSKPEIHAYISNKHWYYFAENNGYCFYSFDNVRNPLFEKIKKASFKFSPDSTHYIYIGIRNGNQVFILDGEEQVSYSMIEGLSFSPNSKHYAYRALKDQRWYYVVDGVEQKSYSIIHPHISFSSKGDGWAFRGYSSSSKKWSYVINSVKQPEYDEIHSLTFSPDGKHWAYPAGNHLGMNEVISPWYYVIDGEEQSFDNNPLDLAPQPDLRKITFSPDSKHWAYVFHITDSVKVSRDSDIKIYYKWYCNIDGVIQPVAAQIHLNKVIFSPDSKHWAYGVKDPKTEKWYYLLDGVKQRPYDQLHQAGILFSPDSKHWAYPVYNGSIKKWVYVVDGKEEYSYDQIDIQGIKFSPNSKYWAYKVQNESQKFYVIDGVAQPSYYLLDERAITFSPEGNHWAYAAQDRKKWFQVIDGTAYPFYDRIANQAVLFSSDGNHWAYRANNTKDWFCVEDGKKQAEYTSDLCNALDHHGTLAPIPIPVYDFIIGAAFRTFGNLVLETEGLLGSFNASATFKTFSGLDLYIGGASTLLMKYQRQAFEFGVSYLHSSPTYNDSTYTSKFSSIHENKFISLYLNYKRYYFSYSKLQPFYKLGLSYNGLFLDMGHPSYTGTDGNTYRVYTNQTYAMVGMSGGIGLAYYFLPHMCFQGAVSYMMLNGHADPFGTGGYLQQDLKIRKPNFEVGFEVLL